MTLAFKSTPIAVRTTLRCGIVRGRGVETGGSGMDSEYPSSRDTTAWGSPASSNWPRFSSAEDLVDAASYIMYDLPWSMHKLAETLRSSNTAGMYGRAGIVDPWSADVNSAVRVCGSGVCPNAE